MSRSNIYLFSLSRAGFDLVGLDRVDCIDGYSEFRRADGTVQAIVRTDLEAHLARAKEALRKCDSVMGETLDKDFGFWSSPAQDDRRSRFYPAWKDASAALQEQDNG